MIELTSLNQPATVDHDQPRIKHRYASFGAGSLGGVVLTCLAIVLRGLLLTTTAVGIVAYQLLTNSHI